MRERALGRWTAILAVVLLCGGALRGEESKRGEISISFLPPPLENATYSLGIYETKSSRLVRRLKEMATEKAFTVGLNGFLTDWDGKDDAGKAVSPGHYAARGYAVGPLKVEGTAVEGNDWAGDDESLRIKRVESIALIAADNGLAVLATLTDDSGVLARYSGGGDLLWHRKVKNFDAETHPWLSIKGERISFMPRAMRADTDDVLADAGIYQISDGAEQSELPSSGGIVMQLDLPTPAATPTPGGASVSDKEAPQSGFDHTGPLDANAAAALVRNAPREARSDGKDDTAWVAAGRAGLVQTAKDGSLLRSLAVAPGDPWPRQVTASTKEDRLYLLETLAGWQRVRGLVWNDAKEENGHAVSTWKTFFERNIHSTQKEGAETTGKAAAKIAVSSEEISLAENPLSPGKTQKIKVSATHDDKGSYLAAADGLRLRQISRQPHLKTTSLTKEKDNAGLIFLQSDGAASDKFSVRGVRNIMEFDAGEIEMTATGEKPADAKTVEPPDL